MKSIKVDNNIDKDIEEFILAVPTSSSQREIWNSIAFDESASMAFNESITLSFIGNMNEQSLKYAIRKVLERHSILNSIFSGDGQYLMVKKSIEIDFKQIEISDNDIVGFANQVQHFCNHTFDLFNGPVIRFLLVKKDNLSYSLVISAHHIVCDGWSWAAINNDLMNFYNSSVKNMSYHPAAAYQFWQYVKSLRDSNNNINKSLSYWRDVYSTVPKYLELPKVNARPEIRTFNSKRIDKKIDLELVLKLKKLSSKWNVSFYQLIYAQYVLTLYKITGNTDIVVGISAAAQSLIGKKDLVGHCVSLLPIRNTIQTNLSFNEFAKVTKNKMLDAYENQNLTFGELLIHLKVPRDISRIPLVNIIFNIDVQPADQGLNFHDLKSSFITNPRNYENFEIFVNLTMIGEQVLIETQYNSDLFDSKIIDSINNTFIQLLTVATEDKVNYISELMPSDNIVLVPEKLPAKVIQLEDKKIKYDKNIGDKLKEIWSKLLSINDIEELNNDSNFFNLGGHSLLVSDMMVLILKELSLKITMKDLFQKPNFGEFAELVSSKIAKNVTLNINYKNNYQIEKKYIDGVAPLSWQQTRAWYLQKLNPDSSLYNLAGMFHIHGKVDRQAYKKALTKFFERHLMSRAALIYNEGIPSWKFLNINEIFIQEEELFGSDPLLIKEKLVENLNSYSMEAISLETDPMFYGKFYYYGNNDVLLYTRIHHLIWDGWCYDIFMSEMAILYNNELENTVKEELSPLPIITYPDYTIWQDGFKNTIEYKKELDFWKEYLKGELPILELPIDFKRENKTFHADGFFLSWDEEDVSALEIVAKRNGTTLFNLIMTAYKILLSRYSGLNDVIIGTPLRGRHLDGMISLIGYFVNSVAVRTNISSDLSFEENLRNVSASMISAFDHPNIAFDDVVRELKIERDPLRTPVYQAFFMYQDATNRNIKFNDCSFSAVPFIRGASHSEIDLWIRRDPTGMKGGFDFDTSLFTVETIRRISDDFRSLLKAIQIESSIPLNNVNWLSSSHQKKLLDNLNSTKVNYDEELVLHRLFENTAKKFSSNIAFASSEGQLSYNELDEKSNILANYLISQNVTSGEMIGVAVPRDYLLPVALLGILKAGGTYVPLDPDYPIDRLDYMISNSNITKLICTSLTSESNAFKNTKNILIDLGSNFWNQYSNKAIDREVKSSQICYVIYTSGSTGLPKGVSITHKSVVNFLTSMKSRPGISEKDIVCAITTLNFDIAVLEIFLPLISGAKAYIVKKDISMFGDTLLKVIIEERISLLQATPSTWKQLLNETKEKLSLTGLCGGEALPYDLAQNLSIQISSLWNMYGPTETTVWSTCKKIEPIKKITIGSPINNTQVYVLNNSMELCPIGVSGELYIGGDGLSAGYFNRSDLTQERFVQSPFDSKLLIYKTGDLAKVNKYNEIECIGRNDGQVKIRGFRIELGEIETVVGKFENIREVVVMSYENAPGDTRLVAFYSLKFTQNSDSAKELKLLLNKNLPPYMIPSKFVKVDAFPLTLNGKIDKKTLLKNFTNLTTGTELETKKSIFQEDKPVSLKSGSNVREILEKIWCEELNIESVKNSDDFFHLGGYSLLSIKVFAKIENEFGIRLPLSTLLTDSNFYKMVNLIEFKILNSSLVNGEYESKNQKEPISLIKMRKGIDDQTSIFFFHAVGGNILNYRSIVDFIDVKANVHGLQAVGVNGEQKLSTSVKEMAVLYALEIEKVIKNSKKIILVGGSFGGLLGLETGRVLTQMGYKIDMVIMFDTIGPNIDRTKFVMIKINFMQRVCKAVLRRSTHVKNLILRKYYSRKNRVLPHNLRYYFIELNNYNLIENHTVYPCDLPVTIMRVPQASIGLYSDKKLGWNNVLTAQLDFIDIEGVDHNNFIESPITSYMFSKLIKKLIND